jgi:hypothetical protein
LFDCAIAPSSAPMSGEIVLEYRRANASPGTISIPWFDDGGVTRNPGWSVSAIAIELDRHVSVSRRVEFLTNDNRRQPTIVSRHASLTATLDQATPFKGRYGVVLTANATDEPSPRSVFVIGDSEYILRVELFGRGASR